MLDRMRKGATSGLVAYIFIGLLVISFGVWGIADIFTGFRADTVATVGDTEISTTDFARQYEIAMRNLGQQMNQPISQEQAQMFGLPQQVLGRLVTQATFDDTAERYGLGLSNQMLARKIAEDPAFTGPSGSFDRAYFSQILQSNGLSEDQYVRERHDVYLRYQISDALVGGLETPEPYLRALHEYRTEERSINYITLTEAVAGDVGEPSNEQLTAYFEEHKAEWRAPEYRGIRYFEVLPEDLAKPEDISDEGAREYYESNKNRYTTVERRDLSQIHFDEQAAAEAAAKAIAEGKTFAEVAADQGLSEADASLGVLTRDQVVDPAIAEAAFSLEEGAVSGVVDATFGYVIVRVNDIQPQSVQSFEAVEEKIKSELALSRANREISHAFDEVEDMRAGGATLAEIASKMGTELVTIDMVDRSGNGQDGTKVAGLPGGGALLTAVFESDVGMENDAVRSEGNGYIWYEVTAITDERDRELDEVREKVVAAWKADEIASRIAAKAEEIEKRLASDETLTTIANELSLEVNTATGLTRVMSEPPAGLSSEAVNATFGGPKGHIGVAPGDPAQNRIVLVVTNSNVPPYDEKAADLEQTRQQISNQLANDFLQQFMVEMQERLGVSVNQTALQTVIGRQPGV